MHLDDLLLRRTRLGLLLPHGAAALLEDVRDICRQELGWDDARWAQERSRYLELWRLNHQVPADQVPPGQAPAGQVPPA